MDLQRSSSPTPPAQEGTPKISCSRSGHLSFVCSQGGRFLSLPGQAVLVLAHHHNKNVFPYSWIRTCVKMGITQRKCDRTLQPHLQLLRTAWSSNRGLGVEDNCSGPALEVCFRNWLDQGPVNQEPLHHMLWTGQIKPQNCFGSASNWTHFPKRPRFLLLRSVNYSSSLFN